MLYSSQEEALPARPQGLKLPRGPALWGQACRAPGVFELYVSLCYNDFTGENVIANSAGVFQL